MKIILLAQEGCFLDKAVDAVAFDVNMKGASTPGQLPHSSIDPNEKQSYVASSGGNDFCFPTDPSQAGSAQPPQRGGGV